MVRRLIELHLITRKGRPVILPTTRSAGPKYIPANSHALCGSLTPADQKKYNLNWTANTTLIYLAQWRLRLLISCKEKWWSEPSFRQISFLSEALVEEGGMLSAVAEQAYTWTAMALAVWADIVFGTGWFCAACRAMRVSWSCSMRQRSNLSTPTRQAVRHSGQLGACLSQVSMGISCLQVVFQNKKKSKTLSNTVV